MCFILIAINVHPGYPFIVAANRDEYHDRPTRIAAAWPEHPDIIAGKDLDQGGTWLGISQEGKFAALTNFRDPENFDPERKSRGGLVLDFLTGDDRDKRYTDKIKRELNDYNAFCLLLGDVNGLHCVSNRSKGVQELTTGIYALSNHLLDTPWPKVIYGKALLEKTLKENEVLAPELLFDILATDVETGPEDVTIFISGNKYGTRCSTVITMNNEKQIYFEERSFDRDGLVSNSVDFEFAVNN